ncbi:hypothetical protein [Vogesella indigofera]|uniref:hypothetical protein n=1 Tax=Vogesella indigofera TaxID=45465 RepID=UPI00234EC8D1|nr:hypothetical protein [Vogesella indigofera]MDC7706783.1 hypothetical protein [Vogesella indigofera]
MKKLLMLASLLLLAACGNNSGNEDAAAAAEQAVAAQVMAMAEKPKCTQGPFKNKHELAKFLTEQVYGKPKQVALDVLGRPESVSDLSNGKQMWHYGHNYCSEPDEITGKELVMGFNIVTESDGMVEVNRDPLTDIDTFNRS